MTITVSTDGSALGNPNGPMGWAWADHAVNAARTDGHQHDGDSDAGGATNGTNQIGELCAVLEALRAHRGAEPLTIETDSQYAINCSTKWVKGWKKNGWKNSQKKPVKNAPLIKAIDAEIARREGPVKFVWVKGHNGNPGNEKVDDLAHTYSGDARSGIKDGYLPLEGWQSLLASAYAKGVDIPADAKMLIAGKITEEQYHLARGVQSNDNDDNDDHDHSENAKSPAEPKRSEGNQATGPTAHKPTLAERLTESEGVPDYDFSPHKPIVAHHRAAENDEPPKEGDPLEHNAAAQSSSTGRTVRSHPDFKGTSANNDVTILDAKTDAAAPTETELPTVNATAGASEDRSQKTESTDNVPSDDSADAENPKDSQRPRDKTDTSSANANVPAPGQETDEADGAGGLSQTNNHGSSTPNPSQSIETAESEASSDQSGQSGDTNNSNGTDNTDNPDEAQNEPSVSAANAPSETDDNPQPPAQPTDDDSGKGTKPQPAYLNSGLSVSGQLRFSPAPQTSPTYNGRPRHIRGVIALDGYVAGNGAIMLSNAPFLIANNNHRK